MKDFWALNDISLDIHSGETFALIGRNGAGKTTLLKVVSRVLSPTHGRIVINGQVAPLLEFGAGFQPELTGRENIYLNGTLLGHRRRDIDEHFEEILSFAQLDGFIDAPLRRYSSGMVARLGFAIATSWKPEILILDEVLAVGDEGFRAKCFTRINKFRDEGSTILLVTHAMSTVLERCNRAAWLDHGNLKSIGQAGDVVKDYLDFIKKSEEG
ncbi:MAG: ABC transporter ATP-binding protein [Anaerolineae bacterium]|nr:ABC transporter ATP-binding protein [Anaerolineae bacterium]